VDDGANSARRAWGAATTQRLTEERRTAVDESDEEKRKRMGEWVAGRREKG